MKSHRIPNTIVTMVLVGDKLILASLSACPTAMAPGTDSTKLKNRKSVYAVKREREERP